MCSVYLAIIEWGWVGYEEFCRSRRVLSTKAEVDKILGDLQNSSYSTKAEFNNCFIIHSKYFLRANVETYSQPFFCSTKITQSRPQLFSVNCSIICSGLHFWFHWFNNLQRAALLTSLIQYDEVSFQIWWTAAGYGELYVVLTNQKRGNILNE